MKILSIFRKKTLADAADFLDADKPVKAIKVLEKKSRRCNSMCDAGSSLRAWYRH